MLSLPLLFVQLCTDTDPRSSLAALQFCQVTDPTSCLNAVHPFMAVLNNRRVVQGQEGQ